MEERTYYVIEFEPGDVTFGWKQDNRWYEKHYFETAWWVNSYDSHQVDCFYGTYEACFAEFLKKYVPLEAEKCQSGGWMSPEGTFYPCGFWRHSQKANDIVAHRFRVVGGGIRQLNDAGWAHIDEDGEVTSYRELTQAQLDTIFDLIQLKSGLWARKARSSLIATEAV